MGVIYFQPLECSIIFPFLNVFLINNKIGLTWMNCYFKWGAQKYVCEPFFLVNSWFRICVLLALSVKDTYKASISPADHSGSYSLRWDKTTYMMAGMGYHRSMAGDWDRVVFGVVSPQLVVTFILILTFLQPKLPSLDLLLVIWWLVYRLW